MGAPTQVTGLPSSDGAANGFVGWSPDIDRSVYTVRGGSDGSAATAYADSTAYAVGKSVTYGGDTYVVRVAVAGSNTTKPDVNASFARSDSRRGPAETVDSTTRRKQFYR